MSVTSVRLPDSFHIIRPHSPFALARCFSSDSSWLTAFVRTETQMLSQCWRSLPSSVRQGSLQCVRMEVDVSRGRCELPDDSLIRWEATATADVQWIRWKSYFWSTIELFISSTRYIRNEWNVPSVDWNFLRKNSACEYIEYRCFCNYPKRPTPVRLREKFLLPEFTSFFVYAIKASGMAHVRAHRACIERKEGFERGGEGNWF